MRFQSGPTPHDRRTVLRAGALVPFVVPLTTWLLTGCDNGYATSPDPLLPVVEAARVDAAAASALARAAGSEQGAGIATAVERVRRRHADVLGAEVERLNRPRPDDGMPEPRRAGSIGELLSGLEQARSQAVALVPNLPRHRAGILGAVAAGCASLRELAAKQGITDAGSTVSVRPVETGELAREAVGALRQAAAAEHAAVWVYGLVTAFLPDTFAAATGQARATHRDRADAVGAVLRAAGATPRPAAPAYPPAERVTDKAGAMRLVVTAEDDTARAWYGVLVRTDDMALRTMATRALTGSAARATRWRHDAGTDPAAPALPGRQHETS